MVKVLVKYKGKGLESIDIKGHAETDVYGKDLVCAAVSAIAIGSLNALDNGAEGFEIDMEEEGHIHIEATSPISEHDQTVLETMIIQLKTIEQSPKPRGTIEIKERN